MDVEKETSGQGRLQPQAVFFSDPLTYVKNIIVSHTSAKRSIEYRSLFYRKAALEDTVPTRLTMGGVHVSRDVDSMHKNVRSEDIESQSMRLAPGMQ